MSTSTLVLNFEDTASDECPLMYVEVPEKEVRPGDSLEIRLWGPIDRLTGWNLCVFGQSLGPGRLRMIDDPQHTEYVDLAETLEAQLEYPVVSFTTITATSPLAWIEPDAPWPPKVWQQQGRVLTQHCSRKGYSCIKVERDRPLYGSLEVVYQRVPSYLAWEWTIPDDFWSDAWFFLYDDLELEPYRKFSIELPQRAVVEPGVRNLSIRMVDFASEAAVPQAKVYLDGLFKGLTDTEGQLHLSDVPTGEHIFKATCEGYLDTDQDGLSNETIVVR